jgi:hypothetical protein
MKDIILETLKDSFEKSDLLTESSGKVNINLLLAGNASRIGYVRVLVEEILKKSRSIYPFIGKVQVNLIDQPKESVGLGAYYATKYGPMGIDKINNPPMTIFTEVPPLFKANQKLLETIGERQGIVIFRTGEKSRNPEQGDVLIKIFKFDQLGFKPTVPQIPISKKIGIDILSINHKLKGTPQGDKLAFLLTRSNRLEIFRFSDSQELSKNNDFVEMIKDCSNEYIEVQFKKVNSI